MDIVKLAREKAPAALDTLAEIAEDCGERSSDRVAAAKEILDRAFGKAPQAVVITPLTKGVLALMGKSDAELESIIDAEFEEMPAEAPLLEHKPAENFDQLMGRLASEHDEFGL